MTPEEKRALKYLQDYQVKSGKSAQPGASARAPRNFDKKQLKGQQPDETDRKNIIEFIKTYDMAYPYPHIESLQRAIQEGMRETTKDVSGIRTTKDTGTQRVLTLPQPFVMGIKKAYPLLFSDQIQLDWFLKNFPNLSLKV